MYPDSYCLNPNLIVMNLFTNYYKTPVFLLFVLMSITFYAQERVAISVYQDVRMALTGDDYYEAGTLDVLVKAKLQGIQKRLGYMFVAPEFEYSDLEGIYKRYAVNAGFTFNTLGDPVEISLSAGYGWIDRWGKSMFSFNAQGEVAYRLNSRLKIVLLSQFTERSDLTWRYGDEVIRFSGFMGIEFSI